MIPSDDLPRTLLEHVPAELMKYTCATENLQDFNLTGFEVYTMLNLAALMHSGKRLHEFESILDFGCGAGRLLQFIPNAVHPKVHGTDVNKSLIDFVNQTFPEVTTCVNDFDPPLIYPSEVFDLIYSFSVFSHFTQAGELAWLQELARVGKQGAIYMITIHGEYYLDLWFAGQRNEIDSKGGFHYINVHTRDGSEMDFPEGYEASFHTHNNIHSTWSQWFNILQIYEGASVKEYLWPDAPIRLLSDLTKTRPMGQALVVMTKK
jgi:SAM-dependent methyltransferase